MMFLMGSSDSALRHDSRLPFHSSSGRRIRRIVLLMTRAITTRFGRSMGSLWLWATGCRGPDCNCRPRPSELVDECLDAGTNSSTSSGVQSGCWYSPSSSRHATPKTLASALDTVVFHCPTCLGRQHATDDTAQFHDDPAPPQPTKQRRRQCAVMISRTHDTRTTMRRRTPRVAPIGLQSPGV